MTTHHNATDLAGRWARLLSQQRLGASETKARSPDRTLFQQDYDRIVFTSAFRRMKDKTQVFPLSRSDYVRTRLTHSIEVSCVGRSLGNRVGQEIAARHQLAVEGADFGAIVAAACLAHDIGNPPFGHAGEDAIREWFRTSGLLERYAFSTAEKNDFIAYEGNAQGFRNLTRLQNPSNPGLQLTCAVLATFTKYPRASHLANPLDGISAKKFGYFQHDAPAFQSIAAATGLPVRETDTAWHRHPLAFLVEVADDACYTVVDLEDAASTGVLSFADAEALLYELAGGTGAQAAPERLNKLSRIRDPKERLEYLRAKAISRMLDTAASLFLDHEAAILSGEFDQELLAASPLAPTLQKIRALSQQEVYLARPALEIEIAGFEVLGSLLDMFTRAVEARVGQGRFTTREKMLLKRLPPRFLAADGEPDTNPYIRLLQIADFVAGMTDSYAVDLYRKLKGIELPGDY